MNAGKLNAFLFSVLSWCLLLLIFGYQFGDNDHIELLPYILKLQNTHLYPGDFFLNSMFEMIPNERHLFALMLSIIPSDLLEISFFVFHFISTVLLVLGLMRFASHFITNPYLLYLAIVFNLMIFYDWNFGKVEMYYSMFQASNIAKAIAIWSLAFFIEGKKLLAFGSLSLATYIQIITGIDLAIVFGICLMLDFQDKKDFKVFKPMFIYSALVLPYLIWILISRHSPLSHEYFDIMFRFRHPHHFFIHSSQRVLLMLALFFISLKFYLDRSTEVLRIILIMASGTLIYYVSVEFLEFVTIANFQWYKNSIWLKFIGFTALFGLVDKHLPMFRLNKVLGTLYLAAAIITVCLLATGFRDRTNYTAEMDLPWIQDKLSASEDISMQVKEKTETDALFIQPFGFTALKYYGQRSSFVDFKAIPRTPKYAAEWYRRINLVYGLYYTESAGFRFKSKADDYFYSLNDQILKNLTQKGITHVLTRKDHHINAEIVAENSEYIVYKIAEQ